MTMDAAAPLLTAARFGRSIIGLMALLLLALPAQAALSCPPSPAVIEIERAIEPPRIDNTLRLPALQRLAGHPRAGRALGLYKARLAAHWTIAYRHADEGGQACRWIEKVVVKLSMPFRMIYIVRERRPGTCAYETVLGHEREHQAIDDAVVEEYRPRLRSAAMDAIRSLPAAVLRASGPGAAEQLAAPISAALERTLDALKREREARQKAVDSPEEYRRVNAACG
ncbi:MAG TPA: hypothetical protein VLX85_10755 [Stellaceae bacterium]|nr:hypothetical protein [Stellaceae bacterium]